MCGSSKGEGLGGKVGHTVDGRNPAPPGTSKIL